MYYHCFWFCWALQGHVFHWCFCFSALNGYLFGNFPEPDMCVGESVSWHLFGMGNEIDIHSIYFYGNTFISRGHRTDVVNLFPATFLTLEMIVENPGKWMITCQVSDHLQGKKDGGQCGNTYNGTIKPHSQRCSFSACYWMDSCLCYIYYTYILNIGKCIMPIWHLIDRYLLINYLLMNQVRGDWKNW